MFSSSLLLGSVLAAGSLVNAATRQFSIEASWATGAPDGFERQVILVNGTSPGPALIVDQGDDVEFYVQNNLGSVATVHFHGIEMLDTPWSDGVPGLSQKPIPAGGSWLYKWKATEYGTYWYHAHYQAQVSDGFYGPIYIRPRDDVERPFAAIGGDQAAIACAEENPQFAMIADWQHVTSEELYQIESNNNIDVYCAQSILINGQGRVNCLSPDQQKAALAPPFQALYAPGGPLAGLNMTASGCAPFVPFTQRPGPINPAGLPDTITGCTPTESDLHNFDVDPTKGWANIHLMSTASINAPVVSLDEHDMWVYAIDGRYIQPYKVQSVQIFNGDRYSVMIPLTKSNGTYTFRANHFGFNQLLGGFASVTYKAGSAPTCSNNGGSPGTPPGYGGGSPPSYGGGNGNGNGGYSPGQGQENPNQHQGIDCGIPGWRFNKPYGKKPDGATKQVPSWPQPDVPSNWDWHGELPKPGQVSPPAYNPHPPESYGPDADEPKESDKPATYPAKNTTSAAGYAAPTGYSTSTSAPVKEPVATTTSCTAESKSTEAAASYAKRSDQFRSNLWRRQSAPSASTPWITYGGFPVSQNVTQLNETFVVPFVNVPPSQNVSATHIFSMSRTTAPWMWKVGGDSYPSHPQEYSDDAPLLYFPESANANNQNLTIMTTNDTWVDLIFTVPDTFGPPHPMHKHSNKAYVIGRGTGAFTWSSVAEAAAAQPQNFNFANPQLRDGFATAPSAGAPVWLAVRYHVVNPGAFLLHCHIQTHLTGGMAVALLDDLAEVGPIPAEYGVNGNGE
ncbi:Laccase abr2 [Pseudocercospora fuligena]|uniref:Laccase abr2 n=1 Tax=Pseudocercospora fuligena TaxID=685502 RepID=A0A8H6R5H7_9PEZI|nr:Laccase abr2 [Pseudocercospora fuligena]